MRSLAKQLRALASVPLGGDKNAGQAIRDAAVRDLVGKAAGQRNSETTNTAAQIAGSAAKEVYGQAAGAYPVLSPIVGLPKLIKNLITGNTDQYTENPEFASAMDDLRKAIRTLNPSLFDSMTASE